MFSSTLFVLKSYWRIQSGRIIINVCLKIIEAFMLSVHSVWLIYILTSFYEQEKSFIEVAIVLIDIGVFQLILSALSSWYYSVIQEELILKTREYFTEMIVDRAMKVDYHEFYSPDFYDQFELAGQSVDRYFEEAYNNFLNSVFQFVAMISAVIAIISIDPRLLFLAIFLFLSMIVSTYLNKISFEKEKVSINPNRRKAMLPSLLLKKEVNIDLKTSAIERGLNQYAQQVYQDKIVIIKKYAKPLIPLKMLMNDFSINFIYIISILFSSFSFLYNESFTIAQFSILFSSIILFLTRSKKIIQSIENADSYRMYIEAFQNFIFTSSPNIKIDVSLIERLTFHHISFNYPKNDQKILQDISFSISRGDKLAIVGENGSGKSTLLKIIAGLLYITDGEAYVNDDINYNSVNLSEQISYIPQDFFLFNMTLEENILGGKQPSSQYERTLTTSWFENLTSKIQNRLGKEIFEDGIVLSGGEAQKVALARGICQDSEIILLDEPTSALDNISEKQVLEFIQKEAETIIFTTHKERLATKADRILLMKDGHLIFVGSPKEMMDNSYYRQLFKASLNKEVAKL